MSSFLVNKITIDHVVDFMSNPGDGDDVRTRLGRALWAMNTLVMTDTYGVDGMLLTGIDIAVNGYAYASPPDATAAQKYKYACCLLYQCTEGGVHHTELYQRLKEAVDAVAPPDDDAWLRASWGV